MDTSTTLPRHNFAAWALKPKQRPLLVSAAPYTPASRDTVVIKLHCVAVNPIDWIVQGGDVFKIKYPAILGIDIAGTIEEVGDAVGDLKVGQKVIAHGDGYSSGANHGAFQKYVVVPRHAVAELPDNISLQQGVVLPLGISTAAAGLYQKGYLALPMPPCKPLDRAVLIWGGSSSVGSCAIQLAAASGAEVYTTASSGNFEYCRKLGASKVFDYYDKDVRDQIVSALEGKTLAGVYHAAGSGGAVQSCAKIADRCKGKSIVVTVLGVPETGIPDSVRVRSIASSDIFKPGNDVGPHIWRYYLPKALAQGTIVPKPDPLIVGNGLRSVQHALDKQKLGVSAAKVVVDKIDQDASKESQARDRVKWLDQCCAVQISETIGCHRSLSCRKHSLSEKQAVQGRSAPLDQLFYLEKRREQYQIAQESFIEKRREERRKEEERKKKMANVVNKNLTRVE